MQSITLPFHVKTMFLYVHREKWQLQTIFLIYHSVKGLNMLIILQKF